MNVDISVLSPNGPVLWVTARSKKDLASEWIDESSFLIIVYDLLYLDNGWPFQCFFAPANWRGAGWGRGMYSSKPNQTTPKSAQNKCRTSAEQTRIGQDRRSDRTVCLEHSCENLCSSSTMPTLMVVCLVFARFISMSAPFWILCKRNSASMWMAQASG